MAAGLILSLMLLAAGPDPALVAHYTFDEGPGGAVKDSSPNNNHGKNLGAEYVKDGDGYVLRFESADAYVDCGNDPSFDLTEAMTIELWFKPLARPKVGEPGMVGKRIESYTLAYSGTTCWGYLSAPPGAGGGRTDVRFNSIDMGAWQHIAVTFDGVTAKMYRDGRLVDRARAVAARLKHDPGNFYLRYPVVWGDKVEPTPKCMMDDVRVYRRALSSNEIVGHYRLQAAQMGKDVSAFGGVRLVPHVYDAASTLLVEADYWGAKPIPPGAEMHLTLTDRRQRKAVEQAVIPIPINPPQPAHSHTTSVCPVSAVNVEDKIEWTLNTADIAAGDYQVQATVRDRQGGAVGKAATAPVTLAAKPASGNAKRLNNLVMELVDTQQPDSAVKFVNPRDGWVCIAAQVDGDVKLSVDGDAVETGEAMRKLTAGEHTIVITRGAGANVPRLTVRAIPQMVFDAVGYRPSPWLKCYGPYNWDWFAQAGIMDVHNVLVERSALAENAEHCRQWKARGRHIIDAGFIDSYSQKYKPIAADSLFKYITGRPGFSRDDRDGMLMSEFDGFGYPGGFDNYPLFADVSSRIARHGDKTWDLYGKFMYLNDKTTQLFKTVVDNGFQFAEEIYMQEKPTELGARQYLNAMVRQRMLRYQAAMPNCNRGVTAVLAYMSIPTETVNVDPNADYKVFMDMQMNLLANDPVFSDLGGVMWYHSAYASEEALRWSARLLRHYCLEGRRDMLSQDPYELTHIINADFRRGGEGWTLHPAEDGAMQPKSVRGLGGRQGRYPDAAMGDNALWTRRSAAAPNRFSQRIKHLQPGRLYSVKMISGDQQNVTQELPHVMNIHLHDVDLLPQRTIEETFTRSGGSYGKKDNPKHRWLTYRQVFFRARGSEAHLTIGDWANDNEPGGPIGRELVHNFIEVEPYLEN